jgi:hypothetical protein
MNYKRLFIYDVACRSDSFMFLYSAADGLKQHARQVEWREICRGGRKAAALRRHGDSPYPETLEPKPTGTRDASKLRGALTRSPITSWMHTPTRLVPAMARLASAEKRNQSVAGNRAFGLRRPRGMAQPTVYCRESEILLSSAHEQSCRSAGHEPQPHHHSGAANGAESAEKNSFPLLAMQPIDKSRFGRENPRKSKEIQPSDRGAFAAKQARAKKTQMDTGPTSYRCREGAKNRLHPKSKRRKSVGHATNPAAFLSQERLI